MPLTICKQNLNVDGETVKLSNIKMNMNCPDGTQGSKTQAKPQAKPQAEPQAEPESQPKDIILKVNQKQLPLIIGGAVAVLLIVVITIVAATRRRKQK